jgi:hypothetical protein
MVLTERKEHIELLAKMMTDKGIKVVELHCHRQCKTDPLTTI